MLRKVPDAASTHIRPLRYGGGSVAVGRVKGLHADVVGDATGPDGRIWVMWYGNMGNTGIIAVTRSNKAVTRFEPIQQYHFANWPFLFVLHGDGRLGPLDLLINGTAPPQPLVNGIYYSRMLPELSATVSVHNIQSGTAKLTIPGSSGSQVTVTVTAPGYQALKERVTL